MDILKILKESSANIYPEDLEFFETELAIGEYSEDYIVQCKEEIQKLRNWMKNENQDETKVPSSKKGKGGAISAISNIAPQGANPLQVALPHIEQVKLDLKYLRQQSSYKSAFKKYVADSSIIDSVFVDNNYSMFDPWEIGAIVSVKQMGETFLEKYFGAIDHDKIARYQQFSESFFMKHFAQLDTDIVLEKGKNEWRKKENRSKQLDVFLRLKGVKL